MKSGRIFFVAVIISTLGLACSDQEKPTSPVSSTLSSPSLAKKQMDTTIVTQGHVKPNLQYCDDGRIAVGRIGPYGSFDHYLAQSGKFIGQIASSNDITQLRQTYGFNRALINGDQYSTYVNAGYAPQNLEVAIGKDNPGVSIDACPGAVEFYTDEPITVGGWSMQDIINVADSVHLRGKKFGIGEQVTFLIDGDPWREYFDQIVMPHLDFITYTNYYGDQRDNWTVLRQRYGSKFDRVWISSTADYGEYANLIGHASNLGINTIFLYAAGGTQQQLESFINGEYTWGWQRKFVQEVLQMWCCTTTTYNPETCELNSVTPTGNIIEAIY